MQRSISRRIICLVLFSSLSVVTSISQSLLQPLQEEAGRTKQDTVKEQVQPIPLAEINSASTEAFQLFARVRSSRMTPEEKVAIATTVDKVYKQVSDFLNDSSIFNLELLSFREIENLNTTLQLLDQKIKEALTDIREYLSEIQESAGRITRSKKRWQLTSEMVRNQNSP